MSVSFSRSKWNGLAVAGVLALFVFEIHAVNAFELEGKYNFDSTDWIAKEVPDGHSFLCRPCKKEIRFQITYGPPSPGMNEDKFIDAVNFSVGIAREFAREVVAKQIPITGGVEIEINEAVPGYYFNDRKMLQYTAVVYMGPMVLRDTTFIGAHGDQIVRVTINYVDGALDDAARAALEIVLSTLTFHAL